MIHFPEYQVLTSSENVMKFLVPTEYLYRTIKATLQYALMIIVYGSYVILAATKPTYFCEAKTNLTIVTVDSLRFCFIYAMLTLTQRKTAVTRELQSSDKRQNATVIARNYRSTLNRMPYEDSGEFGK